MRRKMRRKEEPEMRRKAKPQPPKQLPAKVLHPTIYIRKDGKPTCFVCSKPLHDLREILELKGTREEGTDYYITLKHRVAGSIISIGNCGRAHPLYRHSTCEPGSVKYMRHTYLKKRFLKATKQ